MFEKKIVHDIAGFKEVQARNSNMVDKSEKINPRREKRIQDAKEL